MSFYVIYMLHLLHSYQRLISFHSTEFIIKDLCAVDVVHATTTEPVSTQFV